ncbi:hypothetical protein E2C01_011016 [Portunus trituberculatus]|uniref:Uncharacterized protein n=1 Tax=Portunus trituberculatus TaxID=210409 RepID=A0A5B7D9Z3_PORTR|nr:hypothetical protein [Portunus trituberculatus]
MPRTRICSYSMVTKEKKVHKETRENTEGSNKASPSLSEQSYGEGLQILGLTTLEQRRERVDLVAVYRVMNGLEELDKLTNLGQQ